MNLIYAILGGFIPALFWLWFWLREDKKRPEPRGMLVWTFVGGMLAVPAAMALEYAAAIYIPLGGFSIILIWAFIEEILKYLAARKTGFARASFDEPIDALIYMITAALGFASVENTLFIVKPLIDGNLIGGIDIGGMRFIGATLLHTASSAIVGASIAFSFWRGAWSKGAVLRGIIIAGILHFLFNYFIITSGGGGILNVLIPLWILIIIIIFIFEKIKRVKQQS